MSTGDTKNGARTRSVIVVAIGSLTACVLVAVSGFGVSEPRVEGELMLARIAGEVADAAFAEWSQLRRTDEPCAAIARVDWTRDDERTSLEVAKPFALSDQPAGRDDAVARAILADVRQRAPDDPTIVEDLNAFASRELGAARQVELAVHRRRLGLDAPLTGAAPGATWKGLPVPVALALASTAPLTAAEQEALAQAWELDQLAAAPAPRWDFTDAGAELVVDPRERALVERLVDAPLRVELFQRRAARALARISGGWPTLIDDDRWHVRELPDERWAVLARASHDQRQALVVARNTPLAAVTAALTDKQIIPPGFELLPPGVAAPDHTVRVVEPDDGLAFAVTHNDIDGFVTARGERVIWLRRGLLALAAGVLITSIFLARALRRDARLVEARSAFVTSVSHELRTPVASILTLSENLEDGRARNAERYPGLIRREAERLRRLVDDVLDVARIERGQQLEPRLEECAVAPWIGEVTGELSARAEAKSRRLITNFESVPETMVFDGELLRRALGNLVDNALAHGDGLVTLHVGNESGAWDFTVTDEGAGVPRPERTRVFESFERLGRNDGRGAGLGLGIVRQIAEAHGGRVEFLDPDGGRGARVRLSIPFHQPEPHA